MNAAKFVIVRTDSGYHLRLVGGNGEIVMTSENYTEKATARNAIRVAGQAVRAHEFAKHTGDTEEIDERTQEVIHLTYGTADVKVHPAVENTIENSGGTLRRHVENYDARDLAAAVRGVVNSWGMSMEQFVEMLNEPKEIIHREEVPRP